MTDAHPISPRVAVNDDGTLTLEWGSAEDVVLVHRAVLEGMVEAHNKYVHAHPLSFSSQPAQPPPVGRTGAAKVLEDLGSLQARVATLEDHLEQLHRIVTYQVEHRLNRIDPPLHYGHPGQ